MNLSRLLINPLSIFASAKQDATNNIFAFSAPVNITAAAPGPDGKQSKELPTFSISAYDGGLMHLGWWGPTVVELSGIKARKTVKIFREHDPSRVVGHAESVEVTDTSIEVTGVMSGTGDDVKEILGAHKNGFPWEASIGASMLRHEYVEAGESVEVNGQTFNGPLVVAREVLLAEVSFVAIGAAEHTSTNIAAGHDNSNNKESVMTFEQWLRAHGIDPKQVKANKKHRNLLLAQYKAEMKASSDEDEKKNKSDDVDAEMGDDEDDDDESGSAQAGREDLTINASGASRRSGAARTNRREPENPVLAYRDEVIRVERTREICAAAGNPKITVDDEEVDLQAHAIREGWSADKTELHALRASRAQAPYGNVGSGRGAPLQAGVIEASMLLALGCSEKFVGEQFGEKTVNAAMERNNRGFGLHQLTYSMLAANGGYYTPGRMDNDTLKAALSCDPMLNGMAGRHDIRAAGGGFSTISLSGILSNVANKAMLERFELSESVVSEIAYETETNNFKPFTRYRLDSSGAFQEVGADGELKHIGLVDSTFSNQLATHGGLLALTRQMWINDDLGAFMQLPMVFIDLALSVREQIVFTKLLANTGSFFGTGNKNYITGADTVLGIPGLNLALAKFRTQTSAGGTPILSRPDRVLVGPSDEATAKQLYTSTELNETTTANVGKGNRNPHAGMFKPVVSPYLSTAIGLSGSSDTAWYLLGNPASGKAPIQVGYLQGEGRRPRIESGEANFNTLGIQWRSYWDFGAALFDHRSAVKSKGAA